MQIHQCASQAAGTNATQSDMNKTAMHPSLQFTGKCNGNFQLETLI